MPVSVGRDIGVELVSRSLDQKKSIGEDLQAN